MRLTQLRAVVAFPVLLAGSVFAAQWVLQPGHPSLAEWRLPPMPPSPTDNAWSAERAELGKQLFFDPRLSSTSQTSCASCHFPERGWSDGLGTSVRFPGLPTKIASQQLVNVGYNTIFAWDGAHRSLEQQAANALGPTSSNNSGGTITAVALAAKMAGIAGYRSAFDKAYPGEGVTVASIAKALAAFERTLISRDSPFDRWVAGDAGAMTPQQVNGLRLFVDARKGNCVACHHPPNFTDNGFHNIGLASQTAPDAHRGRHQRVPLKANDGAFKTPGLRDIALTAPFFHDGSARTLREVVDYYVQGGVVQANLSASFKPAQLDSREVDDVVAFLQALTTPHPPFVYPALPR